MSADPKPPGAYVHGDGAVVLLPARVAAFLWRRAHLETVRAEVLRRDPEVEAVLTAMHRSSMFWWASVAAGSAPTPTAEVAPTSITAPTTRLTARQAGDLLHITDRAIRQAIAEHRIPAERVDGRWSLRREDVEHYRAARAARRAS